MAGSQPIVPKISSPLGVFRTSQAVASDVSINVLIYVLIYAIIYVFRLRNLLIRLNQYILSATLVVLEIFWIIPYILVRLIYIIYNALNESKEMIIAITLMGFCGHLLFIISFGNLKTIW